MKILDTCKIIIVITVVIHIIELSAHAAGVSGQGTWEATLQSRDLDGNGTVDAFYDTNLNITWLANANANGFKTWTVANNWANNLLVGSIGNWRLPSMTDSGAVANWSNGDTNAGWNVLTSSSEMASLYYDTLGNKAFRDTNGDIQSGPGLTNTGNFQNMQANYYWSGSSEFLDNSNAWVNNFDEGNQNAVNKYFNSYAIAVHDGDVMVSNVPEPETYYILLAGLGLVGFITRHRRKQLSTL
jgi:hypothetical protein